MYIEEAAKESLENTCQGYANIKSVFLVAHNSSFIRNENRI